MVPVWAWATNTPRNQQSTSRGRRNVIAPIVFTLCRSSTLSSGHYGDDWCKEMISRRSQRRLDSAKSRWAWTCSTGALADLNQACAIAERNSGSSDALSPLALKASVQDNTCLRQFGLFLLTRTGAVS